MHAMFNRPVRSRAWEFFGDMCLFVAAALSGWSVFTMLGLVARAKGYCQ